MKMKKVKSMSCILLVISSLFFASSCELSINENDDSAKIKNTMKSVSLFQDTTGVDALQLLAEFEMVNDAIDSIGYPDAGYKLWEVISEDSLDFRFLVEGYWPDKQTYDLIHDHELYRNAVSVENATFSLLESTWYHRFNRIDE